MERFAHLGLAPADILLPNYNLSKWSVIACDQFTAQPDYWRRVEERVGDSPSSLRLILPEARLHGDNETAGAERIHAAMQRYLEQNLFYACPDSMVYVERAVSGGVRHGLVCRIDLEEYDYHPGCRALIRATERTVLERIPPRVKVRRGAPLELPHTMILVDDGARPLFSRLTARREQMEKLYGFSLMEGGGRIDGWRVDAETMKGLAEDLAFLRRDTEMLFAVGDGNHSLAAAKAIYEEEKARRPREEWLSLPSRWALAEVVSLNDTGVQFLPIHRIVFGVDGEALLAELQAALPDREDGASKNASIQWLCRGRCGTLNVALPDDVLPVEWLQESLDQYVARHGGSMDYIHDPGAVEELSLQTRAIGFLLPPFPRAALFPYVKRRGALPRKTFSIGCSRDKRYYLEARALF